MSEQHHQPGDHGHGNQSRFIQHHYDNAQHQFDAGKLGIWAFLVQEILFFSALFVAYIVYRYNHPEIYEYAHYYLDTKMGAINTAVLILSSLTAAWAVRSAQLGKRKQLMLNLGVTILAACTFLVIKYFEYSHKFHEGILFGQRFDPCVSSGGGPLLTKKNECHGIKSSVTWDFGAKKAASGCLVASKIDQQPLTRGLQATCKVVEKTPSGEREIPACAAESSAHGAGAHGKAACFTLAPNPAVCPTGPAALVHYGDHVVRKSPPANPEARASAKAWTEILVTCDEASGDAKIVGAPANPEVQPGAALVTQHAPLTKHELAHEFSMGPPPPNTSMFFSIYFAMTGLHGIHVLVGIFVFVWLFLRARKGHFTADYFGPVDYAALYWHIVDLIWIFLFPLLYLIH